MPGTVYRGTQKRSSRRRGFESSNRLTLSRKWLSLFFCLRETIMIPLIQTSDRLMTGGENDPA